MLKFKLIGALALTLMSGTFVLAADSDFAKLDTNGDGKLSFEEAKVSHPDWSADAFKSYDTNGDSGLNAEELALVVASSNPPATTTTDATDNTTQTAAAEGMGKTGPATYLDSVGANDVLASKLIGMRIYAVNSDVDVTKAYPADSRKDWADVGEVNDVVLDMDGKVKAVVLGVGGFLGMGEKNVAVEMPSLRKVRESAESNDWFLVVNTTKQLLTNAPAYANKVKS